MAEEKPKGRGRPRKIIPDNDSLSKNEEKKSIQMTASTSNVTLQDVQNQWTGIFNKYSDVLSFDTIASTWNSGFLNNPFIQNQRIKQISSQPINISKQDLQQAMQAPQENEQMLREMSLFLTYTNYVYNGLMRNNRDIPNYFYYYVPDGIDEKDMQSPAFKRESKKVNRILKTFKPAMTFKTISMQVAEEGKTTYVIRKSYNKDDVYFFNLQKLNSDKVKLTGIGSKQPFIASFDFMIFLNPMYSLEQYPPYFTDIFESLQKAGVFVKEKNDKIKFNPKAKLPPNTSVEFVNNTWLFWAQLPQSDVYTFCADASHALAIPETAGMLVDMAELNDYKALQTALLAKTVTSIMAATVPMDKAAKTGTNQTLISPDVILGYEGHFGNNIAGNVMPFFAPFTDYKFFNIDNQPDNMDIIYNRIRDLIATSGNSALNSISDKPSIASVKAAQRLASSKARYLTLQFESFLDQVINEQFDLQYRWKVSLWGDIYNDEELKVAKEMLLGGVTVMLPKVLSSQGLTLEDANSVENYISVLGIKADFGASSSNTNKIHTGKVGRPPLEDNAIENDSTATSADMGNNVSDIKDFSENEYPEEEIKMKKICSVCGAEIDEDDEGICDDCLEELYDRRIEKIAERISSRKKNKEEE